MLEDIQYLGSIIGGGGILLLGGLYIIVRYGRRNGRATAVAEEQGHSHLVTQDQFKETIDEGRTQAGERHTEVLNAIGNLSTEVKDTNKNVYDHATNLGIHRSP